MPSTSNDEAALQDQAWRRADLVATYLDGVRAAVPYSTEQLGLLLDVAAAIGRSPIERVLDLGCGDGVLSAAVLAAHPGAAATLVDFSLPMLTAARGRFATRPDAVEFFEADLADPGWLTALPVGDAVASFDLVVSGFAIHHLPDNAKRRLFRQIAELLRPGGCFLNQEHVASESQALTELFDNQLIDALWRSRSRDGDRVDRRNVAAEQAAWVLADKQANRLAAVSAPCDWLREVGFRDVDCYFKWLETAIFGGRTPREGEAERSPRRSTAAAVAPSGDGPRVMSKGQVR